MHWIGAGIWERLIVAVSRAVQAIGVRAGLLIFLFVEESVRHVNALAVYAALIRAALGDLAAPVSQPIRVRLARQEIAILLADEEVGVIERVQSRARYVSDRLRIGQTLRGVLGCMRRD